jgi:hypothetical protein
MKDKNGNEVKLQQQAVILGDGEIVPVGSVGKVMAIRIRNGRESASIIDNRPAGWCGWFTHDEFVVVDAE